MPDDLKGKLLSEKHMLGWQVSRPPQNNYTNQTNL